MPPSSIPPDEPWDSLSPEEVVVRYHERTKHDFQRFAPSLGYLDWATQPDPFRRFRGAPLAPLTLHSPFASPMFEEVFDPRLRVPQPVNRATLSTFLQYSLALSAWKEYRGSKWALRINPSSGNLHPTEGYVILGPDRDFAESPGVFHYAPRDHALERRCSFSPECRSRLAEHFPNTLFLVGLASIHWREAWKYGERAYRYCQHDVGHAVAALSLSASVLGWSLWEWNELGDAGIASILGLDRREDFIDAEHEAPDLLFAVRPATDAGSLQRTGEQLVPCDVTHSIRAASWTGSANALSRSHVPWAAIEAIHRACAKPVAQMADAVDDFDRLFLPIPALRGFVPAHDIIFQRRSAVDFDGRTGMSADPFFRILDRVMPRRALAPWNAFSGPTCVHLALFVHLVEGVEPGLYMLVRAADSLAKLRSACAPEFLWKQPSNCPKSLPLYQLQAGDARQLAAQLSCGQAIAGDSAFSLGMIAEFESPLRAFGPWHYRRLFWETGIIGQVLYLEAEAAGLRGTGIGCFFDDPVHQVLGLKDRTFQSLYHFTIGGPVEDTRLTTLAPYEMEKVGGTVL